MKEAHMIRLLGLLEISRPISVPLLQSPLILSSRLDPPPRCFCSAAILSDHSPRLPRRPLCNRNLSSAAAAAASSSYPPGEVKEEEQPAGDMVLGEQHTLERTLYAVLSVEEDASYEEIRASYRTKILSHHPDKLRAAESGVGCPDKTGFLEIQEAWETLSDARSRRLYDRELRASRQDVLVEEDVGLEDMLVEDAGDVLQLFYTCRCGDYFSIDSQELEEMGCPLVRDGGRVLSKTSGTLPASVLIPCGSCSLRIRLSVESDATVSVDEPSAL